MAVLNQDEWELEKNHQKKTDKSDNSQNKSQTWFTKKKSQNSEKKDFNKLYVLC